MTEVPRLRLGWILACEAAGVLVMGSAFAVEKWWRWTGVAPSTLVNIGTGLLLAGLLFLLERRFTTQVATQAKAVVEAVDARIEEGTRELETRLGELQRRTDEQLRSQATQDDTAIDALEDVSFGAVTRALGRANRLHALANHAPRVQATEALTGVWLVFSWGTSPGPAPAEDAPALVVTAEFPRSATGSPWRSVAVGWAPADTPEDIGARLIDALRRAGYGKAEELFRWPLAIRNLQRTLRIAVQSRRRQPGEWALRGPVFELVGSDWAVTEKGLEAPDRGYILRESVFPAHAAGDGAAGTAPGLDSWVAPRPPAWADAAEWDYLIRRGCELFPRDPDPAPEPPGWIPELGPA